MEIAVAQQFLRENENAVLATWRRDGRLQMSPVTVGLDGAGRAIISSSETTYKVRNLRRDPRATLCVFVEAFTGPWVQIEGTAEVVSGPEAVEPLVDYYRRVIPENPNLLQSLTFSSYDLTLNQHMFVPADTLWEASNATTCRLCPAGLRHRFLPISGLTTPGKSGATASARRVQTDAPSPTTLPV